MARTTKVSVLVALPGPAIALLALGRTMSESVAQLGVFALAALLVVAMAAVAVWPSDAAVLDHLLRTGDEARNEIINRGLDEAAASDIYDAWYDHALGKVAARFPAYKDDFIVAEEPVPERYSGQMTVVRRLVAKLGVLKEARKQAG